MLATIFNATEISYTFCEQNVFLLNEGDMTIFFSGDCVTQLIS